MEQKLREHVEHLFENAPKTRKAYELKEEMIANLTEKYRDLLAEGKTEEAAFNIAAASIGDIDELLRGLEEKPFYDREADLKYHKRSAALVSTAVFLYFVSLIAAITSSELLNLPDGITGIIMFTIAGVATWLLIYNSMSKPRYIKTDDTMVEEFKEWKSNKDVNYNSRKSILSAVWSLTLALYFIISFAFGIWYISWVIFIIGAAVQEMI
ncbi:MAG: permease prefix domain 1-containing protein, partial [Bacillota bacterium]|nr:permease prefix domain 1-containing protein [Bacillota bacterium]